MLSSEFNATIDQIVPRKIETLWARWRRDSPRYINYAKLGGLPDSPAAIASLEFARMHVHPAVLNHSIRTYYYSIALLLGGYPSKSPDAPQIQLSEIRETIFLSSILHDVGTSNTIPSLSAHTMSFEFHGGIAAHYHLTSLKQPLEAAVVGDVVESIFLHTSPFENGFCSTPVQLLNLSTWLDIIGLTPQLKVLWHEQTIKEIQEAYPRLGLSNVFASLMQVEIEKKPGCICTQKVLFLAVSPVLLYRGLRFRTDRIQRDTTSGFGAHLA